MRSTNLSATGFLSQDRNFDADSLLRISKLSTIPLADVIKLFTLIKHILAQTSITEKELIDLNHLIETFHKQNKR